MDTTTITIKVLDRELTLAEAEELYNELKKLFGSDVEYIPYPIYPIYPIYHTYPTYPINICETSKPPDPTTIICNC